MTGEFNTDNIKARQIEIAWNPGLPIFASEPFLKAVGDEYGWLGGFDKNGNLTLVYCLIRSFIKLFFAWFVSGLKQYTWWKILKLKKKKLS